MNPMQSMKATIWGLSIAVCLASALSALAQEPETPGQTNDMSGAEVLSQLRDLMQAANSDQAEDVVVSNTPPQSDGLPPVATGAPAVDRTGKVNRFDNPGRNQKDDRRSRSRRNSRSGSDQSGGYGSGGSSFRGLNSQSGTNDGSTTLDYAAFRVIVDGNIFNPNRVSRRRPDGPRTPPRSFDAVTLVGTMTYEKGTFAFFDGTSAEYRKALRLTDTIAGYKVASITPNSVKLATSTNQFELSVGSALRREEDGPWQPASQFSSYVPPAASTSTNSAASTSSGSDAAPAGTESDVIKRLMQKREKE
jgi:hypothetical protein